MNRLAEISDCGEYRYTLQRHWGEPSGKVLAFIGLNPSVGDGTVDDRTINRLVKFAMANEFDGLVVLNLFANRNTSPYTMMQHRDPIGPQNDNALRENLQRADTILIGWGNNGGFRNRHNEVLTICRESGKPVKFLVKNKSGHPRHPLYVAADTSLQDW